LQLIIDINWKTLEKLNKRIVILLLILTSTLSVHAQTIDLDTQIEVQFDNISLKKSLDIIAEKYKIRFSYSDSRLNTSRLVSGQYINIPFDQFLKEFFGGLQINYEVIDQQIVLFPSDRNQTIKIIGKVVDELDGSPIPYANISLPESGTGTSTNEHGDFEINLVKLPSELMISHLSHEKKLVYVYSVQSELSITLLPAHKELKEVTIKGKGNKNAYYNLVKKAYDKLNKSKLDDRYGKAFYRQKSSREDRFTEIFEMFYDIRYSSVGIKDWAVQEGRYAFQQNEEYDIFLYNKNFTLLSRMFPVQQPATESYLLPVNPEVRKFFDLTLNEIIRYENRYIAILDYIPKPSVGIPAPSGQLYIDFEDFSILKFKGHFIDTDLEIVGFSDDQSAWENYRLDFEVSFIDDHSDNLLLDFIKIDHHFDYYYNKDFVGKINTSSVLTFYEQYTPAKNKKLGGPIDFKISDMELIDRVGYNPVFWEKNPIVRRTPIEEKLIADFEKNEAFGAVFMNNDEEVVLLPENTKTQQAENLIAQYQALHQQDSAQEIFVRLDKIAYQPDDKIRFAAYIYDRWTFRPSIMGSVLTMTLNNAKDQLIWSDNFDITEGAAFGEIVLSEISNPGKYTLEAHTNLDRKSLFKTQITISPFSTSINQISTGSGITERAPMLMAEGGAFLAGVPTRIAYTLLPRTQERTDNTWKIVDQHDQLIQTIYPNESGIGSFVVTPAIDIKYYIIDLEEQGDRLPLPEVASSGISIKVSNERSRSLQINIIQKPSLPKEIYVLSAFRGKVSTILKTKLDGQSNTIELPVQYLHPGINDLVILDPTGNILAKRQIFQPHEQINIDVESVEWKSRRNNRLELRLKISDRNGAPQKANLSAICFYRHEISCSKCDIRNEVLLPEVSWGEQINFDAAGDSLYQIIDNLLIVGQVANSESQESYHSNEQKFVLHDSLTTTLMDESLFAEVSVSGSFESQNSRGRKSSKRFGESPQNEIFWIPKLNIDDQGMAVVELKIPDKNQTFMIDIQGLSEHGSIGNRTLILDPTTIKSDRKSGKK
jgi:hypothetical protein